MKEKEQPIILMSEKTDKGTKEGEYRDSLGQANPAQDLQKETIKKAGEMAKEREKAAKDAEKGKESERN
jgi:hypothetical protein